MRCLLKDDFKSHRRGLSGVDVSEEHFPSLPFSGAPSIPAPSRPCATGRTVLNFNGISSFHPSASGPTATTTTRGVCRTSNPVLCERRAGGRPAPCPQR